MTQSELHPTPRRVTDEVPFTLPPARLREPSADDLEVDISDSSLDLPLDDTERFREDAETLKD